MLVDLSDNYTEKSQTARVLCKWPGSGGGGQEGEDGRVVETLTWRGRAGAAPDAATAFSLTLGSEWDD